MMQRRNHQITQREKHLDHINAQIEKMENENKMHKEVCWDFNPQCSFPLVISQSFMSLLLLCKHCHLPPQPMCSFTVPYVALISLWAFIIITEFVLYTKEKILNIYILVNYFLST